MNELDYIFAVAALRVKEKSLLSNQDVAQMVSLPTEEAVLDFLRTKGWGEGAGRDTQDLATSEALLRAEEAKSLALMKELGLEEEILEILSYPQLFQNLKAGIKEVATEEVHEGAFHSLPGFDRDRVVAILREKDYDALPEVLQEVAPRAFEAMLQTRDGQKSDLIVDRACLLAMEKAGEKADNRLFKDYELTTVAVTDIKIAVRAMLLKRSYDFLMEALCPSSLLDIEELAKAAVGGEESLYAYLERAGFSDAVEALKVSPSSFERWCDDHLMNTLKQERNNTQSLGPVLAFYLARQNEIKTARIILTGKANAFSDEMIRERVREMYV